MSNTATTAPAEFSLPRRKRGAQTRQSEAEYQKSRAALCQLIRQIRSRMDFKIGARGWCYVLEERGLFKGDFDRAEALITDCRKTGDLRLDICAEDDARETIGLQDLDEPDVETAASAWVAFLNDNAHSTYRPIGFWDDLEVYVEVVVEKLDLRNLFEPVCAEFFVPIANFKGWSDLNGRAAMMKRFKTHEKAGRICVLLLCGDHDPGGLLITQTMRKNLADLDGAVGWSPANLVIIRFGLNADFIAGTGLTWIDNLETSSGKRLDGPRHPDHGNAYVQNYIRRFGVCKCEANALVRPEQGRALCRRAILEHVPAAAVERYRASISAARRELQAAIRRRLA
jgi:hypothetical protein